MSLYQLFLASFKEPRKLILGVNKTFGKIFIYLVFLSLLLSIPINNQLNKIIHSAQKDLTTISKKIPEFSIVDNQLSAPDSSGFIQQTDNFIFTFDPQGIYQAKDIQTDLIGNAIGLAILKDGLVLTVPEDHLLATALPKTLLTVNYDKFDSQSLNKEWGADQLNNSTKTLILQGLSFIFTLIPLLINLVISLFMMSLIGNLWCKMNGSPLGISQSFKIMTFAATIPVILSSVLAFIQPTVDQIFIVMFLTFLIYLRTIRSTFIKPKI